MRKRSVTIKGHRTSIALEEEFWRALENIAASRGSSIAKIISDIDRKRLKQSPPPGLASALRVYILNWVTNGA